jgi:hypothetical protein
MKNKFLHWSPRILSLLFVLFLALFALDVFSEYQGLAALPALFMHLLLPLVLLLAVIAAWKWELVGTTVFAFFAVYYVWLVGFGRHWSWYVSISGPALIIGFLFLLDWLQKRKKSPTL